MRAFISLLTASLFASGCMLGCAEEIVVRKGPLPVQKTPLERKTCSIKWKSGSDEVLVQDDPTCSVKTETQVTVYDVVDPTAAFYAQMLMVPLALAGAGIAFRGADKGERAWTYTGLSLALGSVTIASFMEVFSRSKVFGHDETRTEEDETSCEQAYALTKKPITIHYYQNDSDEMSLIGKQQDFTDSEGRFKLDRKIFAEHKAQFYKIEVQVDGYEPCYDDIHQSNLPKD